MTDVNNELYDRNSITFNLFSSCNVLCFCCAMARATVKPSESLLLFSETFYVCFVAFSSSNNVSSRTKRKYTPDGANILNDNKSTLSVV